MTMKFDRKKAVIAVVAAALLIIGIILLAGALRRGGESNAENARPVTMVRNEKSRVAYLNQNGWEVESPAESSAKVVIPRSFSNVFEQYNELQLSQGFDLSQYCGMEVEVYTYRVTNAGVDDTVLAQMYVLNGSVIGGDVHSTALDGFMTGLKRV